MCVHCTIQIWPKQRRTTGMTSGGLNLQCIPCIHICQVATFLVYLISYQTFAQPDGAVVANQMYIRGSDVPRPPKNNEI